MKGNVSVETVFKAVYTKKEKKTLIKVIFSFVHNRSMYFQKLDSLKIQYKLGCLSRQMLSFIFI